MIRPPTYVYTDEDEICRLAVAVNKKHSIGSCIAWNEVPYLQELLVRIDHFLRMFACVDPTNNTKMRYQKTMHNLQHQLHNIRRFGPVQCSKVHCWAFGSSVCSMDNDDADLDVCIDGQIENAPSNTFDDDYTGQRQLSAAARFSKQKFLHVLADRLIDDGIAEDLERVMHARVPVFNYIDTETKVKCDLVVGGPEMRLKSTILGLLSKMDWRFSALVKLVKSWANANKLVDAPSGMLNSYSLKLLVLFFLQTRPTPVLPVLCELLPTGTDKPLGASVRLGDRFATESAARFSNLVVDGILQWQNVHEERNKESLAELLLGFFTFLRVLLRTSGELSQHISVDNVLQSLRVDTWSGCLKHEKYVGDKAYHLWVDDPLESREDNAARSLSLAGFHEIERCLGQFLDKLRVTASQKISNADILIILHEIVPDLKSLRNKIMHLRLDQTPAQKVVRFVDNFPGHSSYCTGVEITHHI